MLSTYRVSGVAIRRDEAVGFLQGRDRPISVTLLKQFEVQWVGCTLYRSAKESPRLQTGRGIPAGLWEEVSHRLSLARRGQYLGVESRRDRELKLRLPG